MLTMGLDMRAVVADTECMIFQRFTRILLVAIAILVIMEIALVVSL